MKKRILAAMMIMVMVLGFTMSVSAAPSKTAPVYPSGASEGWYEITTGDKEFAAITGEDATKHAAAMKVIGDVNANKKVSINNEIDKALEGKTLIQKFFDLDAIKDHSKCDQRGYHEVELTVSAVTKNCKDIVMVHYSQEKGTWEIITPTVDYDKQTLTFKVSGKDISAMAIYAKVTGSSAAGTSPSTEGVSSAWMLWVAVAFVALGSTVVVSQKKRG